MSKLKIVKADLIDYCKDKTSIFIPHIVNSGNAMGAGVARALFTKWPKVKRLYHEWFEMNHSKDVFNISGDATLGNIQYVRVDDNFKNQFVINMIAQDFSGGHNFKINGKEIHLPPIRYQSLEKCMLHIAEDISKIKNKSNQKYEIITCWFGTGLAGGDKKIITELINRIWIENDISVTICEI